MTRQEERRRYPNSVSRTRWVLNHVLGVCIFLTFVGLILWIDRVVWGPW